MKHNLFNPIGSFLTSWIDVHCIELNYRLSKMLYGTINDSI